MGKSYVGVKRNPAGTGWVYSVHKPGKSRVSHLRSVFPTAKKAAVYREFEIIREKYDQELPANKRNFADEELPKVKSESTKETGGFAKKKAATEPKPAEVVETDETEAEPAEIAKIEDKPKKGKKDKKSKGEKKKKKSDKKDDKKSKSKKKKMKSGKKDNKKGKGKKKKIKKNKEK